MPDAAEEQWSYDGNGNTTAYENPLSETIDYVFDTANRETTVDYPTGTDTSFTYDNRTGEPRWRMPPGRQPGGSTMRTG
jgi:hypothetical protein